MTGQGIPECVVVCVRGRGSTCTFPWMSVTIYLTLVSKYDQHSLRRNDSVLPGSRKERVMCCSLSVNLSNQRHLSDRVLKNSNKRATFWGSCRKHWLYYDLLYLCMETSPVLDLVARSCGHSMAEATFPCIHPAAQLILLAVPKLPEWLHIRGLLLLLH